MPIHSPAECDRSSATALATGSVPGRRIWPLRRRILAAMLLGAPLAAQSPVAPAPTLDGHNHREEEPTALLDAHMQSRRIVQLNVIRQKAMVSDAEKLVRLARELNDDANAGGTTLSPAERMHKAAEIEKLAKGVKEKMTYAIGSSPALTGPFADYSR